jgi:hypothetical protein
MKPLKTASTRHEAFRRALRAAEAMPNSPPVNGTMQAIAIVA